MNGFLSYLQSNWLELSGVSTGIICVWLNTRQNVWGFFWGLISVGLYTVIFWEARLYGDMGLQIVFALLSIYGLYQWLYGGVGHTQLHVRKLPRHFIGWLLALTLGGTALLNWVLSRLTDASLPLLDSFTTTVSLIAQWMLGRKFIENWYLWLFVDLIYVGIYVYKNLYWTAFLYGVYLILCVMGYRDWKKDLSPVSLT
ncbi:nicotinamide riboside transporter PnuC [Siphonobacter curvatus]|uniref:Nicotinamide riboside transporter PnuC n=1 Tax=Siphonobacter curvatus TaxID=2094562 RepID=A0A2S7IK45_9BACT|nr:nicotinamide riboside transporter PnuC [Siphonobacter curvatus]PQA58131.1 hypothetical protein C5O19_00115 [Siphonobacter curvatus]